MFDALIDIAASFRAQNIAEHPDVRIEEDFAALQRGIERLKVERLRRLAEIERRGLHERDGHLSAVSWLASTHAMSRGAAFGEVRVARALNEMPLASEALDEGRMSLGAVSLLARARQVHPDAFARAESALVEAARVHPVGELERVLGHWRHRVESERLETDTLRDGRRLMRPSPSEAWFGSTETSTPTRANHS